MTHAIERRSDGAVTVEQALVAGDLAGLQSEERIAYYLKICNSLGLNPYTKPFAYLTLNNKLVLYALKDCTDQLRRLNKVSIVKLEREKLDDLLVVTATAKLPDGRTDSSIGAVNAKGLQGEALANAMMKCESKAKRRVTLSLCGLGMLDESEVDSIPNAETVEFTPFRERDVEDRSMVLRGDDPVWQRYLELVVELEGEDVGTIERLTLPVAREDLITAGKGIKAMIAERKDTTPAF